MQSSKQVKRNLGRDESVDHTADSNPERSKDKDETLAVNVCDTAPEEEEASKSEDVRGYDPLLACVGDVEGFADFREDDDDALTCECLKYC